MPFQCSGLEPAVCSNQEFMKAGSRVVAGEKNSVSTACMMNRKKKVVREKVVVNRGPS